MMPPLGKVMKAENGKQYFVYGNSRIKISEHFAMGGKPIGDLIVDVVRHTAKILLPKKQPTLTILLLKADNTISVGVYQ